MILEVVMVASEDSLEQSLLAFGLHEVIMSYSTHDIQHQFRWMVPPFHGDAVMWVPRQGIKLHVSASVLNAAEIATIVVPCLMDGLVDFKIIPSCHELERLNRGLYGISQVGKAITIYPRDAAEARQVGDKLVELLAGYRSPKLMSDLQINHDAPVYYRYGVNYSTVDSDSDDWKYLIAPNGDREADDRSGTKPVPDWAHNPFQGTHTPTEILPLLPLSNFRYFPTEILFRRGGGGVFGAISIDPSSKSTRPVVIKIAADPGEQDFDGTSSADRLEHQKAVLESLPPNPWTPQVIEWHRSATGAILVMNRLPGKPLGSQINRDKLRLSFQELRHILEGSAGFLGYLHSRNLVHGDFTLENILFDVKDSSVHFVDFEHVDEPQSIMRKGFPIPFQTPYTGKAFNTEAAAETEQVYGFGCLTTLLALQDQYVDFVAKCVLASAPIDFVDWCDQVNSTYEPDHQFVYQLGRNIMENANHCKVSDLVRIVSETLLDAKSTL